jgi:proline iminopeptidase
MPNIDANGISLHYEARGNREHPAIVLVMGLGVQMILWPEPFCQMLVERGFYVVRFDNRDAGLSTQLNSLGSPNIPLQYMRYIMGLKVKAPYSIDDMAADTAALIDALALPHAHLVGASMGGMIAQNLAAALPARVASLTSIMSTTGRRSLPKASWRTMRAILSRPASPRDPRAAVERMMFVVNTISSRTHRPDQARLRTLCEQHVARQNNPPGGARQIAAIAASDDRTKIVRQIKVPTLVLHGDEDELIPYPAGLETARVIREGGGEARAVIIAGMGHDLPEPLWGRLADEIAAHCQVADARNVG